MKMVNICTTQSGAPKVSAAKPATSASTQPAAM
jgi:hypothetical protein